MEEFEIKTTPFLRYKHVAKFIDEHDVKCNYFLKKFHPESESSLQISHKCIPLTVQVKAFLPKQIIDVLDAKHAVRDIYTRDLENHKTEDNDSRPLIEVEGMRNGRQKVFLQTRDTNEMNSQDTESMKFECSSDEFISRVDLLLEQFALNQFKTKIEQLHRIREEIANNDISGGQTSKKRKLSIDLTTLRSGKSFHPSTESALGGESTVLDEMEHEVLTDTIRSGEALFRRRGNTTEAQEKYPVLTDEVSDGIFLTDQRIHGCGYRSRILNIFVDEQDDKQHLQIRNSIKKTLRKYNIVDFEVLFGLYKIQLFSGHVAGCEVENKFGLSGTLGGYTRNERRKDIRSFSKAFC
ncbi:uncharacterized protein LOC128245123 [Mya arenaria]|uniref:uncharacterized protein LOC128245123 n=1 Tax=Mya arenaria TaxID=6604 RepID=UPI0022DF8988|nr:uncharacterized protein LOC128245123 [Mya arenaria]